MDNMEENSRSTEQDRVANPVEETVSTTVEPALSENKRERKKREKAEKKKNAPQLRGCLDSMVPACLQTVERIPPAK